MHLKRSPNDWRCNQLCLGQKCGIEHAIHSLRETYQQPETEAILLIDASNAFNALNRKLAMRNIDRICPSLTSAVYNSYIYPSKLFVNGETLLSEEGTTQGDPIAMAMYGISIMPMIRKLNPSIVQKWYADDGSMAGTLPDLLDAFKTLKTIGKAFGYFVYAPKCQLIVKNCLRKKAERIFKNSEVEITDGTRVLGSAIGERRACTEKTKDFTEKMITMIQKLAKFAKTSPQNAYACLTKGLQSKLTFMFRTTPDMHQHFDTIENHIKTEPRRRISIKQINDTDKTTELEVVN